MADAVQGQALQKPAVAVVEQPRADFRNTGLNLMQRWEAMTGQQKMWLLGAGLATAAVAGGMLWLSLRPDWRVLYAGLDARDEQQVAQQLTAAGIKFDVSPDGATVRVAADSLDKARLQVAAKGMPQSGRMGFELFDKPNWAGSEFDERVNYQRALEGELEHTIGSMGAVSSARVHLVLPKDGLFASEKQEAKASVVLQLRRQSMSDDEADSIRNLVAGAVEGLRPEQVTLVDAAGRVNLSAKNANAFAATEEQLLTDKLVEVLEPMAGQDNVRASVKVEYDDSTDEQTDEVYDPAGQVATSVQRTEQTMTPRAAVGGVPGTASNTAAGSAGTPAGAATGTAAAPAAAKTAVAVVAGAAVAPAAVSGSAASGLPVYPQGNGQLETDREESSTYAVTKHMRHIEQAPGRVDRITAAVVVNDRSVMEGVGKDAHLVWKPRTPEEMQRLKQLAEAAVGFDSQRGDDVVVENLSFMSNAPVTPVNKTQQMVNQAGALVADNPGAMHALLGTGGVLLLLLLVVRPAAKKITAVLTEPAMLPAGVPSEMDDEAGSGLSSGVLGGARAAAGLPARRPRQAQAVFDHVAEQIKQEPAQTVRLLETWINAGDTAE